MRKDLLKSALALIFVVLGGVLQTAKADTDPTTVSGYHTYTSSDGVTYYYTLSTLCYATLYSGADTVGPSVASHTTVHAKGSTLSDIRVSQYATGSPTSGTIYTDSASNLKFTISLDEPGACIYYATGWENLTTKDANGRVQMVLPDTLTVDGTAYPVNQIDYLADGNLGSNSSTPFDIQLNKALKVIGGSALAYLDNLYDVTFQDAAISLYNIDDMAFYESPNATFRLPDDATTPNLFTIGQYAFYDTSVRSLKFTAPLINISAGAFSSDKLEYVDMSGISLTTDQLNSIILSRNASKIKTMLKSDMGDNEIVYSTYASIFANIPEHVLVYLPTTITDASQVWTDATEGYRNFIIKSATGWKCHHFAVYDNPNNSTTGRADDYVPTSFLVTDSASYDRPFSAGWNTTYLPYSTKLPSGVKAYEASSSTLRDTLQSNGMYSFKFTEVTTDSLLPNTGYLLYSASDFSFAPRTDMLTVPVTPDNNPLTNSELKGKTVFIGTTEEISHDTAATYNAYGLSADGTQWKLVGSNTSGFLGRYRAFIADNAASSSSAKPSTVSIVLEDANGSTTSISGLTVADLTQGDSRIYSINGHYVGTDVSTLPAGIYIKNGKKFLKR